MKKVKVSFDTWIQLLGMLGVLGGLIFVGLEMQQTQNIAIAGQAQARAEMNSASVHAAIEAGIDFHSQKNGSNIQLSEESIQQRNYANLAYARIENDYYQYQQGLMSEEVWQRKLLSIIGWYENCNVWEIWERRKQFFVDDLVQQIEGSGVACQQKVSQLNVAE